MAKRHAIQRSRRGCDAGARLRSGRVAAICHQPPARPAAGASPQPDGCCDSMTDRVVGSTIWAMTRTAKLQIRVGLATVPMVASTLWLGSRSGHLQRPLAAAVYWSPLIAAAVAIGLFWWHRRPASRFGPLLALFGA